jgi:hypothetical protein
MHLSLGSALEAKGDLKGDLEEYRRAMQLDPKSESAKTKYESLAGKLQNK